MNPWRGARRGRACRSEPPRLWLPLVFETKEGCERWKRVILDKTRAIKPPFWKCCSFFRPFVRVFFGGVSSEMADSKPL